MKKKIILIDGNAMLHKAYHGLPPFTTSGGELVNAVYGFASVVLNILNVDKPDYVACAFDVKKKTFRHEQCEDYKANRTKAPDDLYAQLPRIKQLLAAFGVAVFEKEGYEADDIIGTLSKKATASDICSYIVTGDMDTLQLVDDHVRVYAMKKGFANPVVFDSEAVVAKYELTPEQIVDFKGLAGDSSDNIKGVPGIGKKTATNLLKEFGSIDGIYKHLDQLKGAVLKKLSEGRESASLSKRLATIICDVELPGFDFADCKAFDGDENGLKNLFSELEFRSLMAKLSIFLKESERRRMEQNQQALF